MKNKAIKNLTFFQKYGIINIESSKRTKTGRFF